MVAEQGWRTVILISYPPLKDSLKFGFGVKCQWTSFRNKNQSECSKGSTLSFRAESLRNVDSGSFPWRTNQCVYEVWSSSLSYSKSKRLCKCCLCLPIWDNYEHAYMMQQPNKHVGCTIHLSLQPIHIYILRFKTTKKRLKSSPTFTHTLKI